MQHFTPEDDLISMRGEGIIGLPVPADLEHLLNDQLVFDGQELLNVSTVTDWLIDEAGRKRHPAMHADKNWQAITCNFDDVLIKVAGNWRLETDADRQAAITAKRLAVIKAECKRRIYAVASPETQMNMATATAVVSAKTAGSRSAEEAAILAGTTAALAWVAAMRGNVAVLAADDALDYTHDANWPAVPAGVIALVDGF